MRFTVVAKARKTNEKDRIVNEVGNGSLTRDLPASCAMWQIPSLATSGAR